jgi:hypothetical protein
LARYLEIVLSFGNFPFRSLFSPAASNGSHYFFNRLGHCANNSAHVFTPIPVLNYTYSNSDRFSQILSIEGNHMERSEIIDAASKFEEFLNRALEQKYEGQFPPTIKNHLLEINIIRKWDSRTFLQIYLDSVSILKRGWNA